MSFLGKRALETCGERCKLKSMINRKKVWQNSDMAKNMIIRAFVDKRRVKCAGANYGIQNLIYTYIYGNFARILQKVFVSARDSFILYPFFYHYLINLL
jgi:hypothetical protein